MSDSQGLINQGNHRDPKYRGEPLSSEHGDRTKENRSCTDTICCIIFTLGWVAMIIIAGFALANGNPKRLAQAYDSDNHACGVDSGYENYPYIYFAKPTTNLTNPLNLTVCVSACPTGVEQQLDCHPNAVVKVCRFSVNPALPGLYIYNSTVVFDKVCLPIDPTLLQNVESSVSFSQADEYIGDIRASYSIVWACIGIAVFLGFAYMFILRIAAAPLVWFSLIAVVILLGILGGLVIGQGNNYANQAAVSIDDDETAVLHQSATRFRVLGSILIAIAVIILILILVFRRFVSLAVVVLKASARFVTDTWYIVLFPPVMFVLFVGTFAFFLYIGLYLYSAGSVSHDITQPSPFAHITFNPTLKRMVGWDVFFGLWSLSFNVGLTDFILASAACLWYFDETGNKVTKSAWRAVRYHIGSIAFGSLFLAFVWLINWLFEGVANLVNRCAESGHGALAFLAKSCMCCFDCYFRFIRFFEKGAWTLIAVTGENFLAAGRHAVYLGLRNPAASAIALPIAQVFTVFGKAFITLLTVFIGYTIITKSSTYSAKILHPGLPSIIFGVIGYFISALFMSVYGMATEAILYCFLVEMDIRKTPTKKPELFIELKDVLKS